jgi:anti-sigma B factor antagonist
MRKNEESFSITEVEDGQVQLIRCPDRIDINVSYILRDILTDLIEQDKYKIILELKDTNYIDSSGLGAIVSRIAAARSNQGDVRLASAGESINDLLELTHLNKILNSYSDVESAIASYRENE